MNWTTKFDHVVHEMRINFGTSSDLIGFVSRTHTHIHKATLLSSSFLIFSLLSVCRYEGDGCRCGDSVRTSPRRQRLEHAFRLERGSAGRRIFTGSGAAAAAAETAADLHQSCRSEIRAQGQLQRVTLKRQQVQCKHLECIKYQIYLSVKYPLGKSFVIVIIAPIYWMTSYSNKLSWLVTI